jgi:hypothetical protein
MQKSALASIQFAISSAGALAHWNDGDTFFLLQCWLEKIGAYHSSLYFSWAGGSAIFFGEGVSLISTKYHLFIFPSTLTLTLADHCRHP